MLRVGAREETVTPFADERLVALRTLQVLLQRHWWVGQVLSIEEVATLLRFYVFQNLNSGAFPYFEDGLLGAVRCRIALKILSLSVQGLHLLI